MVKQTLRDPYGSLGLRGDSVWIASERRCPIKSNPSQIGAPLIIALATAAATRYPCRAWAASQRVTLPLRLVRVAVSERVVDGAPAQAEPCCPACP